MPHIELKTVEQLRWMREAGLVVASIHEALRAAVRPGVTTRELDEVSAQAIADGGGTSNFLGYYGYPATVCISVNDVIVHGIPGDYELASGDIVSFDCGAFIERGGKQWHGDAAFSVIVGEQFIEDADFAAGTRATGAIAGVDEDLLRERRELDAVTRESLWAALAGLATGKRISAVGKAVETVVAENALINGWEAGIVEEFVGHGIGTRMHMPPDVLNYNVRGIQARLKPGMVLAVEPMLTRGDIASQTDDDEWTVRTVDGRDAAHWEHSIAITAGRAVPTHGPDIHRPYCMETTLHQNLQHLDALVPRDKTCRIQPQTTVEQIESYYPYTAPRVDPQSPPAECPPQRR